MARPKAAVVFPFPSPVYTCINPLGIRIKSWIRDAKKSAISIDRWNIVYCRQCLIQGGDKREKEMEQFEPLEQLEWLC